MTSAAVRGLQPYPAISVVIPAYRAAATIGRAVDSVLAQEGVETEIVVVVDGVSDGTELALRHYPEDRVRLLVNPENLGAAATRNRGLEHVQASLVMFLDADDFLEGPILSALAGAMKDSEADVGFAPMQILHEREGRREPKVIPSFASPEDVVIQWHVEGTYVTPCSVLWRTEFVRKIGGWDKEVRKNDDGELVIRAILLGARFAQTDRGCGVYVKHSAESLNNRTDNMRSLLIANEKLLALDSPTFPRRRQQALCAAHYFNVAWHCYLAGQTDLGNEALARSRALGFKGTRGPLIYRLLFRLIGVPRTVKLIAVLKRRAAIMA